jgi:hypothetical protein
MNDENIGKIIGIYRICGIYNERTKDGHLQYNVECTKCGHKTHLKLSNIKTSKICRHTSLTWANRRIGKVFDHMKSRCYNIDDKDYRFYGAKGVRICDEWLNNPLLFEEWALNNGYADNLTIDRIDADKNYSPINCRWISLEENARRAGKVNWITVDNITLTGRQWAKQLGLGVNAINKAIRKYGIDKTKELISVMLKNPSLTEDNSTNQSWFSIYEIKI